ncbi:MAG TPA: translocation/assembly module TamB domain-containing protein, partial [Thermomonas sp.]|nr:translocation/assembly module TamB domain-containing protein [Thermomonas sp.]
GGLGTLAVAAAAAALLYWLLMTIGGRDALLAQIVARLPPGTEFTWRSAQGPAAGPLTLRGVHFSMPRQRDPDCRPTPRARCAMGRIVFDADSVTLDPALRPLLGRTLRLDALDVRGAVLDLPRSDAPFELPRWPDVLPEVQPPLALRADAIRIDGLQVRREGAPLLRVRGARGGLDARPGRLHVEHLAVGSDRGRFTLHGDYAPADDYRSDLLATAVLPSPAGTTAPRLALVARGDLARMVVALAGRAPAPLRATLVLEGDKAAPRWRLDARSDALDPGLLAGGEPGVPLHFRVAASGTGGDAGLQGTLQRGELAVTVRPSKLRLQDQRLQLQPLVLETLGGRIVANGFADLRDPAAASLRLALNARGLRWRDAAGDTAVLADADLGIAGTPARWALKGQARLARDGDRATVDVTGSGDRDGMRVDSLAATMPQGRLDASGTLAWTPALQWTAQARLAGFDPGYFAPDWPGAIRGTLRSDGRLRPSTRSGQAPSPGPGQAGKGLLAHLDARDLGGTLRGRALSGHASVDVDGDAYAGEIALALGGSRIDARGRIATAIEVDANVAPLRLDDLLPDGRGTLRGTLRLRGARNAPDVDVDLAGEGLAFGDLRAGRLQARGRLPWRGGGGALSLDARDLRLGVALDALHAELRGAVERLAFDAGARGGIGTLALRGDAARQGARWQGTLAALRFAPAVGAAWTLRQPARWAWDGRAGSLSPACLGAEAGGELCASADWPRRGARLTGTGLPLALLAPYLPERSDGRPWVLAGEAALDARLQPAGGAWRGSARLTSASGGVRNRARARRDLVGYRDLVLEASFDPRRITATLEARLDGDGRLDARIATGWDAHAPLDGDLRLATAELTWMELLSPDIVAPTGRLDADLRLGGTRAAPLLGGEARLQGFATELPALGIALEQGDLRLRAQPDGSARLSGRVRSGDGVLELDGTLGWQAQDTPLVLALRGRDVLLADTRQLRAVADPDLVVRYRAGQPLRVEGTVTVTEADIHLERLDEGVSASDDVVVLDPVDPTRSRPNPLDLDLVLAMGDDVAIDGFGLSGSLGGKLRVRAAPGREVRATGSLDVAGRYRAYGQNLQVTRGRLTWADAPIGDPRLDIRAEREVGEVTAGIRVEGRASAPRATVYSNPARSESEALAYLTLGRPLSRLTGDEARQLGAAKSALNAGTGLLASELGARLGLDDAGVTDSRALGGDVLSVGKYLSPRLYVGYGVSLLGTGQVLMLKYLLRKGFYIQVESSTVENRASVNWRKER